MGKTMSNNQHPAKREQHAVITVIADIESLRKIAKPEDMLFRTNVSGVYNWRGKIISRGDLIIELCHSCEGCNGELKEVDQHNPVSHFVCKDCGVFRKIAQLKTGEILVLTKTQAKEQGRKW